MLRSILTTQTCLKTRCVVSTLGNINAVNVERNLETQDKEGRDSGATDKRQKGTLKENISTVIKL